MLTGDEAIAQITDIELDYITAGGRRASLADGMRMIVSGIDHELLGRLRFGLGTVARHGSRLAVPILLGRLDTCSTSSRRPLVVTSSSQYPV